MSAINFYASNPPEYFYQKSHWNWGNAFVHSDWYKKSSMNPFGYTRQYFDYQVGQYTQMPFYMGHVPQLSWVYGNLDYSFNKYHRHYQSHDDWLPDRKNKTLGHKNGSMTNSNLKHSKFMVLQPQKVPRGCYREIRKY